MPTLDDATCAVVVDTVAGSYFMPYLTYEAAHRSYQDLLDHMLHHATGDGLVQYVSAEMTDAEPVAVYLKHIVGARLSMKEYDEIPFGAQDEQGDDTDDAPPTATSLPRIQATGLPKKSAVPPSGFLS